MAEQNTIPGIPSVQGINMGKFKKKYSGEPDYIAHNKAGREPMQHMFVLTGASWVGGFVGGGLYGLREGWKGAQSTSMKVRMNSVLNAVSKRGTKAANFLGVVAYLYTGCTWVGHEVNANEKLGSEWVEPALAGLGTGLIYKSTAGFRVMALAGVLGAGASCIYTSGSAVVYSAIFGKKRSY